MNGSPNQTRKPPDSSAAAKDKQVPIKQTGLRRYFPILDWGSQYGKATLTNDLVAATIVTVMLIPQSLAYALLAGLPPIVGLYASILPLIAYAIFGTSRTLSVGPVAVVSLMTAAAAGNIAVSGTPEYLGAAIALALLSGLMLLLMGIFRLGFLANLLSHPVVSGFITASGIIIATSQLKHLFGISASGDNLPSLVQSISSHVADINIYTLAIGASATAFLFWVRKGLKPLLEAIGIRARSAEILTKAGPVFAILATTLAVVIFDLREKGVKTVGEIAAGLPPIALPEINVDLWSQLLVGALLISIIGFVESVSVAQTLAAKRRQHIEPNQELIGLGASNIASAFSGGYPVTGGFSRSVVNFDAGAETPAAGAYTAVGIALASVFLTPLLFSLPIATLAATIIVAVLSLVDLKMPVKLWRYSKSDFSAIAATIGVTLAAGVEKGVIAGVGISLMLYLWRASRPHAAIVGRLPGTEHFRNIKRHKVITDPALLTIRVDESLTYLNARWLEEFILGEVADNPDVADVIIMCSAINAIDASGLESLEAINQRLNHSNIRFHLSEVKGPVMDKLKHSHLLDELTGELFLSQNEAFDSVKTNASSDAGHNNEGDRDHV